MKLSFGACDNISFPIPDSFWNNVLYLVSMRFFKRCCVRRCKGSRLSFESIEGSIYWIKLSVIIKCAALRFILMRTTAISDVWKFRTVACWMIATRTPTVSTKGLSTSADVRTVLSVTAKKNATKSVSNRRSDSLYDVF